MAAMKSLVALLGLIATVGFAQTSGDFTLPAPVEPFSAPLAESVNGIAADALAAHIAVLASPPLEGRGLASRGYDAAVEYATAQLKLAGVEPFGDTSTSYEQRVPVRRFANAKGQVEITRREGSKIASRTFTAGVDAVIPETVVVAFWTGEEEGQFGSDHYVRNPRWPLDTTRAYLNLDMIGNPWLADEIRKLVVDSKLPDADAYLANVTPPELFVEPGVPRGVPALESALRRSAKGNGVAMHLDWTDGMNGGSDYRGFARRGVPFIRFFGNFFPGYHTARDVREALDPKQVERVARFAFASAWMLVNE